MSSQETHAEMTKLTPYVNSSDYVVSTDKIPELRDWNIEIKTSKEWDTFYNSSMIIIANVVDNIRIFVESEPTSYSLTEQFDKEMKSFQTHFSNYMIVEPSRNVALSDNEALSIVVSGRNNKNKDLIWRHLVFVKANRGYHLSCNGEADQALVAKLCDPIMRSVASIRGIDVNNSSGTSHGATTAKGVLPKDIGNSRNILLPPITSDLRGQNELRVRNPNEFTVMVGVRSSNGGMDFDVPANGQGSIYIPNGQYDIYFVYSNNPSALFQGDSFNLYENGVEIQIVRVVNGNYGIRQVK
jgi:hypothetical protein